MSKSNAYMPLQPVTLHPDEVEHNFSAEGMKAESTHGFLPDGEVRRIWLNGATWFEYDVACECGARSTMRMQMAVPATRPEWQRRAMLGKSF